MLSLKICKQLLGSDIDLSDDDIESIKSQFYVISNVVVDVFESKSKNYFSIEKIPEQDRYAVEERAAILEYDAGFEKTKAETIAFQEYIKLQGDKWKH